MNTLKEKITNKIAKYPGKIDGYRDLFSYARAKEDLSASGELKELLIDCVLKQRGVDFFELYKQVLLWEAPKLFDSYMLYIELNRKPSARFYQPRRKKLKFLVDALQELADGKLNELFLSMPPRVGKTTLLLFYTTWLIGKDSEASNLYSAYSDIITKAFFNGVLEIISDDVTYLWKDVFPDREIASTNASEETLNIDRKKHYPTLTCRSLYGTLNGACDCTGIVISDDLIGGIEEALNKDRMVSAWSKVDNNLIPRAKETAKVLWCGTRWSTIDPAGLRMDLLENDELYKTRKYKIINVPALDEKDESNFEYEYGVGFSSLFYKQRRASFERNNDMASWFAQYQGEPIERQGTLFAPDELKYYNGILPDELPDRIYMAVDPAFGGGDYVASPVCFQYGSSIYVHDVVFCNENKKITQNLLVNAVLKYIVQAMQIEATKMTESYKEGVEELLRVNNYRLSISTKAAPTNVSKEMRIFDKAPDIRENMIFRESGNRSKEYELFMQNVFSFKIQGKNKHDDAPDSLAMAIDMSNFNKRKVEIFKRRF